jgi:hypothetical protein
VPEDGSVVLILKSMWINGMHLSSFVENVNCIAKRILCFKIANFLILKFHKRGKEIEIFPERNTVVLFAYPQQRRNSEGADNKGSRFS